MRTYPLQQHKQKQESLFLTLSVLHVYIPSTTTQSYTRILVSKIPGLTGVHTLYTNTNINKKGYFPK